MKTWATGFNASHPTRLKVPTWVTLRGIPREFLGVGKEIAGGLGELLGCDKRNASLADQRFCVALQSGQGWKTVTNDSTKEKVVIAVDYCNLPIRCRFCHSTEHLIRECPSFRRNNTEAEEVDSAPLVDSGAEENGGAQPDIAPPPPPLPLNGQNPTILLGSEGSSQKGVVPRTLQAGPGITTPMVIPETHLRKNGMGGRPSKEARNQSGAIFPNHEPIRSPSKLAIKTRDNREQRSRRP